jgi:hypothetical protein
MLYTFLYTLGRVSLLSLFAVRHNCPGILSYI